MLAITLLALSLAIYLSVASGFSFTINNTPQQCSYLSISITGSGQPPYTAYILPYGPSPLPNNIEPREVLTENFSENSTSVNFQLTYPGYSQFVIVVSDTSGFATGGTSGAIQVQSSGDSSCYSSTQSSTPSGFYFNLSPDEFEQCRPTQIWWGNDTAAHGSPQFYIVIPGGQSVPLHPGTYTSVDNTGGVGFNWTVPLPLGTTVILVGGDNRGVGTGGWVQETVQRGSDDTTCLNSSSPSSTPGSPAGGAYPTSGDSVLNDGKASSGDKPNLVAIVGGSAGGAVVLLAILLVCLCFVLRRRRHEENNHPVNFLQHYQPETLRVPNASAMSSSHGRQSYDPHQPIQANTMTSPLHSGCDVTVMSMSYGRQSNDAQQSMQMNSTPALHMPETAEALPAYSNIHLLHGNNAPR